MILPISLLLACKSTSGTKIDIRGETAFFAELAAATVIAGDATKRPAVVAIAKEVTRAIEHKTFDVTLMTALVSRMKELQSEDSKVAIIAGKVLLKRYGGNLAIERPQQVELFMLGLQDGLNSALTTTP